MQFRYMVVMDYLLEENLNGAEKVLKQDIFKIIKEYNPHNIMVCVFSGLCD